MRLPRGARRVTAFAGLWTGIALMLVLCATFPQVIAWILIIACAIMMLILTWHLVSTYIDD